MSETTTRGDGVIVDRSTATGTATATGTLTRPGRAPRREPPPARETRVPGQGTGQGRGRPNRAGAEQAPARPGRPRPARPGATVAPPRPAPGRAPAPKPPAGPRAATAAAPAPAQAAAQVAAGLRWESSAANRMPFIVLLCGLLGGALVSALVISTTLADGSFEISKLQQSDNALARQRQQLQDEVAQAQSAPVIEQRAYELGMRPLGELRFVNLKTGKIATDAGSGEVAAINVPGYTP
jgi:hypothetical protein